MQISWSLGDWLPVLHRLPHKPDLTGKGQVAITIDDGPNPDTTPAILDLLAQHQGQATFFLSGWRLDQHADLVARIVAEGHGVYAHGWDHVRLDKVPSQQVRTDMERCEAVLARFRPTPFPYLIRLPKNGGYRNARVHRILRAWQPGCQFVHWSHGTEDHMISPHVAVPADIERLSRDHIDHLLARTDLNGGIVLMHDQPLNDRPGAEHKAPVTIAVIRLLLEGLTARGWKSVPVIPKGHQPWWTRFMMV